jgi:mRNA interferase RelE/StbE
VQRYEIGFAPAAERQFRKLERPVQQPLATAIDGLRSDPRPAGAKLLVGDEALWRIRVGAYRVVYVIEDQRLRVLVVRLGPRRDVYRGL